LRRPGTSFFYKGIRIIGVDPFIDDDPIQNLRHQGYNQDKTFRIISGFYRVGIHKLLDMVFVVALSFLGTDPATQTQISNWRGNMGCVAREVGYNQVCVWPSTLVGAEKIEEFVQHMRMQFGARVQYLEEIYIIPGQAYVPGPADTNERRCELFFAVHDDDLVKFAIPRLAYGIRWVEDVLSEINGDAYMYPERVKQYKTWEA